MNLNSHRLQHGLSRLTGFLTRQSCPFLVTPAINWFIHHYGVNMQEALHTNPKAYANFNAFFTRALKPGCRPLDPSPHSLVAPCDGQWLQAAPCEHQPIYAKGAAFDCDALLAHDKRAALFAQGAFANFYLSPKDYHRVHMPASGTLQAMTYIPGQLHSVDPRRMPKDHAIYSDNERLVCYFKTDFGPMALVMVGALNVGSIHTVWHGTVVRSKTTQSWTYPEQTHHLKKGAEMGHFNLGSTVIVCLPFIPDSWLGKHNACCIQYGQSIANSMII